MLPTPILKTVSEIYHKPEENEPRKPIAKYGRFIWLDGPSNPGPSLAGKPHCVIWNTILYGSWVIEGSEDGLDYGNRIHKAYAEWFLKTNGSLYDDIKVEVAFALAPLTLRPDILYGKNGEYGIVEVKSYGAGRIDEALPQLSIYVYGLRTIGFNITQAFLVMRDAVVGESVDALYKMGEYQFKYLRDAIRMPPDKPGRSCFKCPYALVCRIPKPSLFS
jgi:CRISPR/Cas system-associated exonuclease Cas4 (RecB family)